MARHLRQLDLHAARSPKQAFRPRGAIRRDPSNLGIHPGWGWSAANRRVLYNRASCDGDGKPWIHRENKSGGT